ncbi:MAG: hypothetical protein ACPLXS_01555 [Candidatus Micrarchaeales archaeon]
MTSKILSKEEKKPITDFCSMLREINEKYKIATLPPNFTEIYLKTFFEQFYVSPVIWFKNFQRVKEEIGEILFKTILRREEIDLDTKIGLTESFIKIFEGEENKKRKESLLKKIKKIEEEHSNDSEILIFLQVLKGACYSKSERRINEMKEKSSKFLFDILSEKEIGIDKKLELVEIFRKVFEKKEKFRIRE